MTSKELLSALLKHRNSLIAFNYAITHWPDEEERNARACDAIAEGTDPRLAMEHTRMFVFDDQGADNAKFMRVLGELEAELKNAFPFNLSATINIRSVKTGFSWSQAKAEIKKWLIANAAGLPLGASNHSICNVPVTLKIWKEENPPSFTTGRTIPAGFDAKIEMTKTLANALADKNDQLSAYKQNGFWTLLLLESQDVAFTSIPTVYSVVRKLLKTSPTPNIDEIWIVRTHEGNPYKFFCLVGSEAIMNAANPPNFMFGPQYDNYWDSATV